MASRVNTKFVILLSLVLGGVFVFVAGAAWYVVTKSASALAAKGDAAMAVQDYDMASYYYSKAVAKDQANVENLEKWQEALSNKVPDTDIELGSDYAMYRSGILRTLANLKRDDINAYREYLDEILAACMGSSFNRTSWESLIEATNDGVRKWARYDLDNNLELNPGVDENGEWNALRRYSGVSFVMIMNERLPMKPHEVARAHADLEAAVAADPQDSLAARFHALWYFNRALVAERDNDLAQAAAHRERGIEILDGAITRMPDDPDLMLSRLAAEIDVTFKRVDAGTGSTSEQNRIISDAMAPLTPMLDNVENSLLANQDGVDAAMVATFERLARLIDSQTAGQRADRLVAMLLESDPEDFDAMLFKANLDGQRNDHAERVAVLERLIELPSPKVSLRGLRLNRAKRIALIELINAETVLAVTEGEPGKPVQEHIENAESYRDSLAQKFTEGSPYLLMADARLSLARDDINTAQRLLVNYNKATQGQDVEGLLMEAEIAERANQLGNALELYENVLEIRPSHIRALDRLAAIFISLDRNEEAAERLEEILDYVPQHETARERLKIVEAMLGRDKDPVVLALVNAERVRNGSAGVAADPERALLILENAVQANDADPRLGHMSALTLLQLGRNDEAAVVIDEYLNLFPDNRLLVQLNDRLAASDSLEATLAYIDTQNAPEVTLLLNKYAAARSFGEDDQADAFLDEAMKQAPTNAGVVEQAFYRALLRRGDLAEAERLAKVAEEYDVDRAGGLAFRASILLEKGDVKGAAAALDQAVAIGTATSRVWRLLGDVRRQIGDAEGAVQAYAESVRINPNDVESVTEYVNALAATGASNEALRVAREKKRFVGRSPRLMELWLRLEGAVGNREIAIAQRQFIRTREPDNRENMIALASLLVDAMKMTEAKALIDQLRAQEDSLALVAINAKLLADQGDIQGAVDQFRAHVLATPEAEQNSTPMVTLGRFLIARGRIADGVSALESARQFPDEPGVNANIVLADAFIQAKRFDEALGALQASIDDGRDVTESRKRMVVVLLNLGRPDEAEAALAALGSAVDEDLELMLMSADIARASGDMRAMRDILDRAVATFRDSPVAYLRRADALKSDPQRLQDVLQDLNTALKLSPGYSSALQLRAAIYFTQGRETDGINDLRTAVKANPLNDGLRSLLLSELLKRGKDADAQNVAQEVIDARPGDRTVLVSIGDVFTQYERWTRAEPYYAAAWALQADSRVLERYAESLIQLNKTTTLKQLLATPGFDVNSSAALLMVRARLNAAESNMQAALRDAEASLGMLPVHQASQEVWFSKIRPMFKEPQLLISFLARLSQARPENQWLGFFAARIIAQSANPDQGIAALEQLSEGQDYEVRFAALTFLGEHNLRNDNGAEAADCMRRALEIRPDDLALNNNLAYLYAERLDRPSDALPYATKAAELAPTSVNVLDTLAATYVALDRDGDARTVLDEALRISMNDSDRAMVLIRSASLAVDNQDRIKAQDNLDDIRTIMERNPQIQATYDERYQELRQRIR